MLESKSVFLFGYSGHAFVIIESLLDAGYLIEGYFDLKQVKNNPYSLRYLGSENSLNVKSTVGDCLVFPAIGDNFIRQKLLLLFEKLSLKQFIVIDPSANISKSATIGYSTYIGKNVVVNAQSNIGNGVILNTNCIVEHECYIDDLAHIAPSWCL